MEEFERHIDELIGELSVIKRDIRGNLAEYERNKAAVANMRDKYGELQQARDLLNALSAEIDETSRRRSRRRMPTPYRAGMNI